MSSRERERKSAVYKRQNRDNENISSKVDGMHTERDKEHREPKNRKGKRERERGTGAAAGYLAQGAQA